MNFIRVYMDGSVYYYLMREGDMQGLVPVVDTERAAGAHNEGWSMFDVILDANLDCADSLQPEADDVLGPRGRMEGWKTVGTKVALLSKVNNDGDSKQPKATRDMWFFNPYGGTSSGDETVRDTVGRDGQGECDTPVWERVFTDTVSKDTRSTLLQVGTEGMVHLWSMPAGDTKGVGTYTSAVAESACMTRHAQWYTERGALGSVCLSNIPGDLNIQFSVPISTHVSLVFVLLGDMDRAASSAVYALDSVTGVLSPPLVVLEDVPFVSACIEVAEGVYMVKTQTREIREVREQWSGDVSMVTSFRSDFHILEVDAQQAMTLLYPL
ncbi:hypothetical protein KIPB_003278 [Kipferlia bialata]|uniref:Uncharacterized protein n=1 Tax=Kipferlia bialata TaxID=797122 RepID=A0A9K3CRZ7_9EUKA|nr:hypothetical protein KIPB_003278 [Kipferlia bialata]|eukprot:g3278.t1